MKDCPVMPINHTAFATTTRGLQRHTPPMKLYEKAKRYGIWNPSDLDLTQDKTDWVQLQDDEREVILHLTSYLVVSGRRGGCNA